MEDYISIRTRKYVGKGTLSFDDSVTMECDFEFMFRNDGKSKFEVVLYITNDNCSKILDLLHGERVYYASFEGNDTKNGKIKIDNMAIDGGNIDGSTVGSPSLDKYKIRDDLLRKILSVNRAEQHITSFRNLVFTSRLRFLLMSQAIIDYESCQDSDILTSVSALSNFQFGPTSDDSNAILPNIETFEVNIDDIQITFERNSEYDKLISQCIYNRNPDVTSTAIIDIKKSNIDRPVELLNKICMLLSFSNGNWIIPIYTDNLKNGRIIRTIFYNNKIYRFNNPRHLIDPRTAPYTQLVDFLSRSYSKYDNLIDDFRIHKVIEYYISGQVNSIRQEKFAIGYIALEVLCNVVPLYAKRKGDKIKPKSIEETYVKLKKLFEEMKFELEENQIQEITDKVAYKKVTIKDAQRYLLKDLSLPIDDNLISELYDIRNKLYHGVDYNSNYQELSEGIIKLFDLLDRIILSIFGLKGISYCSKVANYKNRTL